MLKKLASLLFEEEEEVQVQELDEVIEAEPKASLIAAMNPEPQTKSIEIQKLDLSLEPEPLAQPKSSFIHTDAPIEAEPIHTYEFRPVMSPMFGVSDRDRQKVVKKPVEVRPQPTPSSRINTIISPIYGDLKQEDMRVEVDKSGLKIAYESQEIDEIELEEMDISRIIHAPKEELKTQPIPAASKPENLSVVTEDVDDVTLELEESDDLLDNEAHQFSLFDEGIIDKL